MRSASAASISRPVSNSSNATLNRADSAATRTSDASARASPPPDAAPFTAAITGWRSDRSFGTSDAMCRWTRMPACTLPAPVSTTTRHDASARTASSASSKSSINDAFMALSRSGRSRVRTTTPSPTRSLRTVSHSVRPENSAVIVATTANGAGPNTTMNP